MEPFYAAEPDDEVDGVEDVEEPEVDEPDDDEPDDDEPDDDEPDDEESDDPEPDEESDFLAPPRESVR